MAKNKLKDLEKEAAKPEVAAELAALVTPVEAKASDEEEPKKTKAVKTTKVEAKKAPKHNALAQARQALNKVFKDSGGADEVLVDESRYQESMPHLPTGSVIVDFLIGGIKNKYGIQPCPGLPRGKVVNLYGMESSGKTTLCLMASAETCRRGGQVCYIDFEQAVDIPYAKALGVPMDDPDQFLLVQPPTFEKGLSILWTMIKAGVDLIVVDSVASGATKAQWEKSIEETADKGRLGDKASTWSEFFPKLKAEMNRSNTCVIGISQLRANIVTGPAAAFAEKDSVQGGKAWRFYSEVRIKLKKTKKEVGMKYDPLTNTNIECDIGNFVNVHIDKCKVSASQGRDASFYIRYGEGIDNLRSIIEIASARDVIKASGAWFNWTRTDGTSIRGQGLTQFRNNILAAPGAAKELERMTLDSLANAKFEAPQNNMITADDDDGLMAGIDDILAGSVPGVKRPEAEALEE